MEHEPCSLLSYTKRAMKFPRTNPVLVIDDHPNRRKPLSQRDRTVLENSSSLKAELGTFMLAIALPYTRLFQILHVVRMATRTADNAIRPAQIHHKLVTVVIVLKVSSSLNQSASEFHRKRLWHWQLGLSSILNAQISGKSGRGRSRLMESEELRLLRASTYALPRRQRTLSKRCQKARTRRSAHNQYTYGSGS